MRKNLKMTRAERDEYRGMSPEDLRKKMAELDDETWFYMCEKWYAANCPRGWRALVSRLHLRFGVWWRYRVWVPLVRLKIKIKYGKGKPVRQIDESDRQQIDCGKRGAKLLADCRWFLSPRPLAIGGIGAVLVLLVLTA